MELTVKTRSGDESVTAEKYGPFCIHRTTIAAGFHPRWWTVTHTRSGMALDVYLPNVAKARSLARRMHAARLNWDFDTELSVPARTRARAPKILKAWRQQAGL